MQRALAFMSVAVCLSPLFGQAASDPLITKYSAPIEQEFRMRLNIALAISYSASGQMCKLELRPTQDEGVISRALIDELVDEHIPAPLRGTPGKLNAVVCAGFCMKFADYQQFSIVQADQDVKLFPHRPGEARAWLAVVQFKACQDAHR